MATRDQAVQWAKDRIGASIDVDGIWGKQCVDFIAAYTYENFGRNVMGANRGNTTNAIDLKSIALPQGFTRIQNSATFIPEPGDIFIFTLAPYGHTGVVMTANMNSFTSVDQNWYTVNGDAPGDTNGSPAALVSHNYNTFWGVIRPSYTTGVNREQIAVAYQEVLERPADEGGIQTYLKTGWDIERIKTALKASDEYRWLQERKAAEQAAANAAAIAEEAKRKAAREEAERIATEQKAIAEKAEADRLAAEQAALEASKKAGYTEADRTRDNETNNIIKLIWKFLTNIFKGVK